MTLPRSDMTHRNRFVAAEDIHSTFRTESGGYVYEIRVASRGGTGSDERMVNGLNQLFELARNGTKIVVVGKVEEPPRFTPINGA